jgi:hypothetical protein
MLRRMLLPCAVLSILAQLSGCTRQKPSVPVQAVADTAPVRAEIQRIEASVPKITDRGAALFLLAKEYAQIGELPKSSASPSTRGSTRAILLRFDLCRLTRNSGNWLSRSVVATRRCTGRAWPSPYLKRTSFPRGLLWILAGASFTWAACITRKSS